MDLRDILAALGERIQEWHWRVDWDFEAYGPGENVLEVTHAIWDSKPGGIWMSSDELVKFAEGIDQIIDGEFLAVPIRVPAEDVSVDELDARSPDGEAELVIRFVDSTYCEVSCRHIDDVKRLQSAFAHVEVMDSRNYP